MEQQQLSVFCQCLGSRLYKSTNIYLIELVAIVHLQSRPKKALNRKFDSAITVLVPTGLRLCKFFTDLLYNYTAFISVFVVISVVVSFKCKRSVYNSCSSASRCPSNNGYVQRQCRVQYCFTKIFTIILCICWLRYESK